MRTLREVVTVLNVRKEETGGFNMKNWRLERRINHLEKEKVEALVSQDPLAYYIAVTELGCDIEDMPLYEHGLAEKLYQERQKE